ncbi:J domain-containing protein [Clostridium estertheticum]|uniref:J domain-containing protein n=1 Tax=Clostridium estertheticum TaxID=238834 RepID=UPI001C0CA664|nr:J domain-containing protein [Clostridium estertheticum]MBU3075515.1 J domain-containing protein [Clostridium estertheticum]MBU3165655.1 J domain-containing protein [Clostridium estertheticum]
MNYYDILGVEKSATQEEIKQAYRSLVKKYHPDVNTAGNANTFFILIQEAYNSLSNEKSRKNYDLTNNNCETNNTYSSNYNDNKKDDSWFNTQTVSDEEIKEYIRREKSQRSIFTKILRILLKIIFVVLIPIISFTKHVSMWISGVILFISRIIMGLFILIVLKDIYDNFTGGTIIGGWKGTIGSIIVAFVAYCLPYIVMMIPVGLELLRDKIQEFIFE